MQPRDTVDEQRHPDQDSAYPTTDAVDPTDAAASRTVDDAASGSNQPAAIDQDTDTLARDTDAVDRDAQQVEALDRQSGNVGPDDDNPDADELAREAGYEESYEESGAEDQPAVYEDRVADQDQLADHDQVARAQDSAAAMGAGVGGSTASGTSGEQPLLPADQAEGLRQRWRDVQATFVDDPRQAVSAADVLVSEAISMVTSALTARSGDAQRWREGDESATDDLLAAFRKYRDLFNRLLGL